MAKTSKYKKIIVTAMIGAAGLLSTVAVQAGQEISRGEIVATTCYTCHGTYGVSTGNMPGINGVPAEKIKKTLMEFKEKKRASTVMGRHASGYTDEEITEVANFLGKLQKRGE
jgi:sulfide dehydrogenase cytochrome subunit